MPATPTQLIEINDIAKDYYSDVYVNTTNPDTPLKNTVGRLESFEYTGRKFIFAIKTRIGGGASNAGGNKQLPEAQEGAYDQGEETTVRTYTRMAADLHMLEVTKKSKGSYRPAMAELMEDRLQAHDLEVNRQMFCGGDGRVALVGGTPGASATQMLANDYGVTNGGAGTRHVHVGDVLAFYTNVPALIGRRTVVDIDRDLNTVTLDSTITTTATTNFVSKSTADDDNRSAGEAKGLLLGLSRTAALHTIPATNTWRAAVSNNGGTLRPLTDSLVMTMVARIRTGSRKTPNLAVCREGVVLRYTELFLPLRRIDGQDEQIIGGYKAVATIQYSGGSIPVMTDPDCPNNRLMLLNTTAMGVLDLLGTEWAQADGVQFDRVDGKDAIEGYIRKYWGLAYTQRNAHGIIEDVEDIPEIDRWS
jgi:hypothetical protein